MNSELKDRVFKIPDNILNHINNTFTSLKGNYVDGVNRAKKLLQDKTVTYSQLKKIIHELNNLDKYKYRIKYNLAGGDLMLIWSKQHLNSERELIRNNKQSRKRSDEIGSITGERKNSFLKSHTKKDNFKIPTNIMKSNSEKSSISSLLNVGLFEEIEKIKNLIIY